MSPGCLGGHPSNSLVRALEAGQSRPKKWPTKPKWPAASSWFLATIGTPRRRPMTSAISRVGTPSSATAWSSLRYRRRRWRQAHRNQTDPEQVSTLPRLKLTMPPMPPSPPAPASPEMPLASPPSPLHSSTSTQKAIFRPSLPATVVLSADHLPRISELSVVDPVIFRLNPEYSATEKSASSNSLSSPSTLALLE